MAETKSRRFGDALLENAFNNGEILDGQNSPMLDPKYGGAFGWSPVLGYQTNSGHFEDWISNQNQVSTDVIPIVLQAPKFFNYMPQPDKWVQTFKAMWELHPKTIDGLAAGIEGEFDETPIGGGGEFLEEIVDAKRARTRLKTVINEKHGMPFQRFLKLWWRYGLMDPDTKSALIGTIDEYKTDIYSPDYKSGTVLFIKPDITHRFVLEAWLSTNIMPMSEGEVTGKRDLTTAKEIMELDIDWTSITLYNDSVSQLGQYWLEKLSVIKTDPNRNPVFVKDRAANLADEKAKYGYETKEGGESIHRKS